MVGTGFRVDRVSERMHFVQTEHVNWAVYVGPDGVTLIDSGYRGQREQLAASLSAVGCRPEDVTGAGLLRDVAAHVRHLRGAGVHRRAELLGEPRGAAEEAGRAGAQVLVVTADRGLRARLAAGVAVAGPGWLNSLFGR